MTADAAPGSARRGAAAHRDTRTASEYLCVRCSGYVRKRNRLILFLDVRWEEIMLMRIEGRIGGRAPPAPRAEEEAKV